MAITNIKRDFGIGVNIVRLVSTDTLAAVGTTGYLTAQADNMTAINNGVWEWELTDMVLVYASDGWGYFTIDPDFESLNGFVFVPGVENPTVIGDFAVYSTTNGNLEDLGYLPSDATKTSVVMAGSAVVVNRLAHFVDTAGTIDDTAAAVTNLGDIYAGASGTAGAVRSYPASANGYLELKGVANSGNFAIDISNASHGQASTYSIPDGGQTTSNILISNSSGTQTIATGNVAMTVGYLQESAVNALTAHVGGGQGSALALTRQINRVTTVASSGDSVLLPVALAGRVVTVINAAAANAMDVFPQSGEIINALSANTALSVAANKCINFYCAVNGTWNSLLTA